jgi:hypothetical protein
LKAPNSSAKAGSVVFAVGLEAKATLCLKQGLFIAGIRARVEYYRAYSTTTLCKKCSGLGYNPDTCKAKPRCKYCGKQHYSSSHYCRQCNSNRPCSHIPAKCSNCPGAHESGSTDCIAIQGLRPRPRPRPIATTTAVTTAEITAVTTVLATEIVLETQVTETTSFQTATELATGSAIEIPDSKDDVDLIDA